MFTNKHDPLVDSVKSVMEKNNLRRQVEEALNEELGVSSRKAVPHEHLASYDAMLEEAYKCAMEEDNDLSPKQKALANLGTVTGLGGNPEKIDNLDLAAARKGHAHKVGLEEKLTKSMSAGDVISDFVHSKNPKFKGKSKKERMEMALGAYYSKHPEKSKKMDESLESIMEEIRANLEEKLVSVYESGDAQMFEEFVSSLTEEQLELLGLSEVFGGYAGDPTILSRASQQTYLNQQRQAAGQRTISAARPSAAPTAAPAARPATPSPTAGRPAPAPTAAPAARPAAPGTSAPAATTAAKPQTDDQRFARATPKTPEQIRAERDAASPEGKAQAAADTAERERITRQQADAGIASMAGTNSNLETNRDKEIATQKAKTFRPPESDTPTAGAMGESSHIRESLESFIRNRFIKG
jgi:organic radical activating enzyme